MLLTGLSKMDAGREASGHGAEQLPTRSSHLYLSTEAELTAGFIMILSTEETREASDGTQRLQLATTQGNKDQTT